MSASYVPEKVNAVCTYQTSSDPSQFIATRKELSVAFDDKGVAKPLLTVEDKNVIKEFSCKAEEHSFWSILAFGAGLIVGALLVLSGPIGWAVLAVGAAIMAYAIIKRIVVSHKCSEPLEAGTWSLFHPTVKLDGARALTHNSILKCEKGGLLTPIFDQAVAKKVAGEISSNNVKEVVIDAAVAFAAGMGTAAMVGEVAVAGTAATAAGGSAWLAGGLTAGKLAGLMVIGTGATVLATDVERQGIRDLTNQDSESYKKINEVDENEWVPEFVKDPSSINGDDPANIRDLYTINPKGFITGVKENVNNVKMSNKLQGDLDNLLQTMKDKSPDGKVNVRDLHKEPLAKDMVKDIRDGKYPDKMVQSAIDGNDVVRPKKLPGIEEDIKDFKAENVKELRAKPIDAAGNLTVLLPLVATYFSEMGRQDLANAIEEDSKNGIKILAVTQ